MASLPMSKEREASIIKQKKLEKKAKINKSMTKLLGLCLGLGLLIFIVIIAYLVRKS